MGGLLVLFPCWDIFFQLLNNCEMNREWTKGEPAGSSSRGCRGSSRSRVLFLAGHQSVRCEPSSPPANPLADAATDAGLFLRITCVCYSTSYRYFSLLPNRHQPRSRRPLPAGFSRAFFSPAVTSYRYFSLLPNRHQPRPWRPLPACFSQAFFSPAHPPALVHF